MSSSQRWKPSHFTRDHIQRLEQREEDCREQHRKNKDTEHDYQKSSRLTFIVPAVTSVTSLWIAVAKYNLPVDGLLLIAGIFVLWFILEARFYCREFLGLARSNDRALNVADNCGYYADELRESAESRNRVVTSESDSPDQVTIPYNDQRPIYVEDLPIPEMMTSGNYVKVIFGFKKYGDEILRKWPNKARWVRYQRLILLRTVVACLMVLILCVCVSPLLRDDSQQPAAGTESEDSPPAEPPKQKKRSPRKRSKRG